jgi:oligo-alginate lyase
MRPSRFYCACVALWFGALVGSLQAISPAKPSGYPRLMVTADDVASIRAHLGQALLFDQALAEAKARLENALSRPQVVPVPLDAAGATHERHKQNYQEMHLAGFLYQVTGDARYAGFVKAMLEKYAVLYPTLSKHPAATNKSYGRLFWQSLNETVWLVHVTQAYDCIHDTLTAEERRRFETNIFRPMAEFFSVEHAATIDKVHNHGTWMAAAVGMTGYVLNDADLVKKALYGSKGDGRGGYLRQLDELFSPNGYYAEGPYYARYVLMPFYLFAQVVENNEPAHKIFARRDGVLGKALQSLLQQSAPNGAFFPINDSLKEKTIASGEVVLALNLAYRYYGEDARLLSIAKRQKSVSLTEAGFLVAKALGEKPTPPAYDFKSTELADGPDGKTGALGILRAPSGAATAVAVFKYTGLGMDHGHYDKLAFMLYDQDREILSDYGAARFLNVEQKRGGRYLPENESFAKQTIAHNTVVVDRTTQYGGVYEVAEPLSAQKHFFEVRDPDFQVASARDVTAVPGVTMQRTLAMVRDPHFQFPVVVDVFRVVSTQAKTHDYDLPFYYQGHFLATNAALTKHVDQRRPLGTAHGYQHLWLEAEGPAKPTTQFTWMNGERYYTLSAAMGSGTSLQMVRIGANDPNFNLRNEPAVILKARGSEQVFANVIEPHGLWDGNREVTFGGFPTVETVRVLAATDEGTVVSITGRGGLNWTLLISNRPAGTGGQHRVEAGGVVYAWEGNAELRRQPTN